MNKENESTARDIEKVEPILRSIGALLIFMFRQVNFENAYIQADWFIEQLLKDVRK